MANLIIIFTSIIIAKIVIVDDIGLTNEELESLKNLGNKHLMSHKNNPNERPENNRTNSKANQNDESKQPKNILEFPRDFVNQKKKPPNNNNEVNKSNSSPLNVPKHENKTPYNFSNSNHPHENQKEEPSSQNTNNIEVFDHTQQPDPNINPKTSYLDNDTPWSPINSDTNNDDPYNNNVYDHMPIFPTIEDEENNLVRKERENISDANRARTQFIDLKLNESKQRHDKIEHSLFDVETKLSSIDQKLRERKNEYENILQNRVILKNRKQNLINNQRKYEMERDKADAGLRLINNEIAHLYKQLDDLKSRAITTKEERNVYEARLKNHESENTEVSKRLNETEAQINEYQKELYSLENLFSSLKNQLGDLDANKSKEASIQNKLEMEKERISRSVMSYI